MTSNEKAMVGARIANLKEGSRWGKITGSQDPVKPIMSFREAADKVGVSVGSAKRGRVVVNTGTPRTGEGC
jgi:hypothetical protein